MTNEKEVEQMARVVTGSCLLSLAHRKSSPVSFFIQDFMPLPNRLISAELHIEKTHSKCTIDRKS